MNPTNNLINGASYLFAAFPMLVKSGIRRYVIGPIIINLILFALFLWLGIEIFQNFIDWSSAYIPNWLHWLNWLFWILFALSFLAFSVFSFTLFAGIIAAPLNSLLAEKVELLMTGQTLQSYSLTDFFKDIPRMLKREWHKLIYFIPRALALLILFVIPGINLIAPFIWFIFNAWMMAIQYLDYPMDNHRLSFQTLRTRLQQQRMTSLGFGTVVMLLTLVPGINLFILPTAVIGGTLMWIETNRETKHHAQPPR